MPNKEYSQTAKQRLTGGGRTLSSVTAEMNEVGERIASMALHGQSNTAEYKQLVSDLERIQRERAVLMNR